MARINSLHRASNEEKSPSLDGKAINSAIRIWSWESANTDKRNGKVVEWEMQIGWTRSYWGPWLITADCSQSAGGHQVIKRTESGRVVNPENPWNASRCPVELNKEAVLCLRSRMEGGCGCIRWWTCHDVEDEVSCDGRCGWKRGPLSVHTQTRTQTHEVPV